MSIEIKLFAVVTYFNCFVEKLVNCQQQIGISADYKYFIILNTRYDQSAQNTYWNAPLDYALMHSVKGNPITWIKSTKFYFLGEICSRASVLCVAFTKRGIFYPLTASFFCQIKQSSRVKGLVAMGTMLHQQCLAGALKRTSMQKKKNIPRW